MQLILCCLVNDPKHWYSGMLGFLEHIREPIQRFHQKFTKVSLTSKLCCWSTSKLCIYIDYMVAFVNSASMYYIEKLNNGEYPSNRKSLSVKYDFKCAKQLLGSLYCGYYVCEQLRTCGQYIVNCEDVSHHCFMYLYFVSPFFHCLLNSFLLHQYPNYRVEWDYPFYKGYVKRWSRQCCIRHLHVLALWDLSCRCHILQQDRGVSGVSSTI
jgi:hypothetical protein